MYYNYQDVLKRMPDSEIKYINNYALSTGYRLRRKEI